MPEVCIAKIGSYKIRCPEIGVAKVGVAEISSTEVDFSLQLHFVGNSLP
jgi:hypothetical protein